MPEPKLLNYLKGQQGENQERAYLDLCTQIDNILHSYDDELDAFAELVQNSLDEIIERFSTSPQYEPRLEIHVDCAENKLTVLDNASGIPPASFPDALRPNCSLKRNWRRKSARGEKGAALVFLQFGHNHFSLHSKHPDGKKSYELRDGRKWFVDTMSALSNEIAFAEKQFPAETYKEEQDAILPRLNEFERGCWVEIQFGEGCKLENLSTVFGTDVDVALNRLEHILRTRTAVGYVIPAEKPDSLPDALKRAKIIGKVTAPDRTEKSIEIQPGFHYPHLFAKKAGAVTSLMTNPTRNSELIYDFITREFLDKHFATLMGRRDFKAIVDRYQVNGYVSYAYQNQFYEVQSARLLGLKSPTDDELLQRLIQINGGFQIAVREYPNGRRHAFLHRSGAEDKSRTYVVLNFRGDYKPDYGRKNVADEVRAFVNELCKALIAFATSKERKENLKTGESAAPHKITDLRRARQVLASDAKQLVDAGVWIRSAPQTPRFSRPPVWEAELAVEFVDHVLTGRLPGFVLYGLPAGLQLDGLFDYALPRSPEAIYDADARPLGIFFPENTDLVEYQQHWLEFKLSSDLLINDINKRDGDDRKKYFVTIDLLICYSIDTATEGYTIEQVATQNTAQNRLYFGVTHLLRSAIEASHIIQVICLSDLRARFE